MPRSRKDKPPVNLPQRHSAWPHLHSNPHLAQKLTGSPEFQLFLRDLANHRSVNGERLIHLRKSKDEEDTGMLLRGAIASIDFILDLPAAVEEWKKQS